MRLAQSDELKNIHALFTSRRNVFPHFRLGDLKRRIENKQCIFEEGVVITFQQYRKLTRVGNIKIPAKSVMLHEIVNRNQFSGAGGRVLDRFFDKVVVPSGGDLYLTVRAENVVACEFFERHGMRIVGKVAWSGGTIRGFIYCKALE